MWKLFNKLFGWQYGVIEWGNSLEIRRIQRAPNGLEFIKIYGTIIIIDNRQSEIRKFRRLTEEL